MAKVKIRLKQGPRSMSLVSVFIPPLQPDYSKSAFKMPNPHFSHLVREPAVPGGEGLFGWGELSPGVVERDFIGDGAA